MSNPKTQEAIQNNERPPSQLGDAVSLTPESDKPSPSNSPQDSKSNSERKPGDVYGLKDTGKTWKDDVANKKERTPGDVYGYKPDQAGKSKL